MVINKILKQLTPERIKKEIKAIQKVKIPPELQKWVKEYKKVGKRSDFIFLWLYRTIQMVTLPIIIKKYQRSVWKIKFLIAIFVILLDDAADKIRKKRLLEELLKIPLSESSFKVNLLNQTEQKYFKFTLKVWNYIERAVKKYPRYKEFREIFNFDIVQLLNTMRYAHLVNKNPFLINKMEYWLYSSYSEESVICFTLDLMCSSNFNIQNLGIIRELAWQTQKMTRIGDCLSTWEREIKEGDLTSGIFAYAVNSNVLAINDLIKKKPLEIIKKIKNSRVEYYFLKEWERAYREFNKLAKKHHALIVKEIFLMPQKLIVSHLSSKGYY